MSVLTDHFQREFSYLRLSLLPTCNFKCVYCLPNGNPAEALHKRHLTPLEIQRLVASFSRLGIRKVRLTGGEPTLRTDLIPITRVVSQTSGIEKVALTTNGFRLCELAGPLKEAGLSALNVSVDSLNPQTFHEITAQNLLMDVLSGIKKAQQVGIPKVKVNVVVLKGLNDHEFDDFLNWAHDEDLEVRFIELMSTHDNLRLFSERHLDLESFELKLLEKQYQLSPREKSAGPASIWKRPGKRGAIGLIRPTQKNFCDTCNRLRVTSEGQLQLCLFGNGTLPLRHWLQAEGQEEQLAQTVRSALQGKAVSHFLSEGNYGTTKNFATMGG